MLSLTIEVHPAIEHTFVASGPNRSFSGVANTISAMWRHIKLRSHFMLARFRSARCYECMRAVRWWHRRIWLEDGDRRCTHMDCSRGQIFLKAFVADQIRRSKLMADEIRRLQLARAEALSPGGPSQSSDEGSKKETQNIQTSVILLSEPIDSLQEETQPSEASVRSDEKNPNHRDESFVEKVSNSGE
jgi:hypothetical protein